MVRGADMDTETQRRFAVMGTNTFKIANKIMEVVNRRFRKKRNKRNDKETQSFIKQHEGY